MRLDETDQPATAPLFVKLPTAPATRRLGVALGKLVQPGDVLTLDGQLGAGKTTLVQGVAQGLGVAREAPVGSPTFNLVSEYRGRLKLVHADLYRLNSAAELDDLGLWEAAEEGAVLCIEWASRFPGRLPDDPLEILLGPGKGREACESRRLGREASLRATGPRSRRLLMALRAVESK